MNEGKVQSAAQTGLSATVQQGDNDVDYWTIEGMRAQEFSVGIFIFMLAGVGVFLAIVFRFMTGSGRFDRLKTGEKVMFIWIILGTIAAVAFGATQLLHGYLF